MSTGQKLITIVNNDVGLPYLVCNGQYDAGHRGIFAYSKTIDVIFGEILNIKPLVTDSAPECWNATCDCWALDAQTAAEGQSDLWCATMTALALREDGHDVHDIAEYIDSLSAKALVTQRVNTPAVNRVLSNLGEDVMLVIDRDYDVSTPVPDLSHDVQEGVRMVLEGTLAINGYSVRDVREKADELMDGTIEGLGEWLGEPLGIVDICTYSNDERAREAALR